MRLIKLQAENVYLKPGATGLKQIWNHEEYSGVGPGGGGGAMWAHSHVPHPGDQ